MSSTFPVHLLNQETELRFLKRFDVVTVGTPALGLWLPLTQPQQESRQYGCNRAVTVEPTGQDPDDFCDGISNFRAGLNDYVEIIKSLANCWKFRHVLPLFRVPLTFPN
jgi:hypothetical protein